MINCLNIGCGHRFHPTWTNVDIISTGKGVIAHDITRGIPFPDNSFDVVYHSAVLEHIRYTGALPFMCECYRVLQPGGIVRVGVPDLEQICRQYLAKLEACLSGNHSSLHDYEWVLLEMYDQTIREQSGGRMLEYLNQYPLPNADFVYERIGEEGRQIVSEMQQKRHSAKNSDSSSWQYQRKRWLTRLRFARTAIRDRLLAKLLGPEQWRALKIGRFRLSGEVHQWMYDRYSLSQLLVAAGFCSHSVQSAVDSQIPNWASFNLDTTPEGAVNKPDSLFMEARKPLGD